MALEKSAPLVLSKHAIYFEVKNQNFHISGFSEDGKVTIGKYDLQGHGIGAVSLRMDGSWNWEFEGFEVQTDSWVGAGEGNVRSDRGILRSRV